MFFFQLFKRQLQICFVSKISKTQLNQSGDLIRLAYNGGVILRYCSKLVRCGSCLGHLLFVTSPFSLTMSALNCHH